MTSVKYSVMLVPRMKICSHNFGTHKDNNTAVEAQKSLQWTASQLFCCLPFVSEFTSSQFSSTAFLGSFLNIMWSNFRTLFATTQMLKNMSLVFTKPQICKEAWKRLCIPQENFFFIFMDCICHGVGVVTYIQLYAIWYETRRCWCCLNSIPLFLVVDVLHRYGWHVLNEQTNLKSVGGICKLSTASHALSCIFTLAHCILYFVCTRILEFNRSAFMHRPKKIFFNLSHRVYQDRTQEKMLNIINCNFNSG